ncbi:MAG TPA: isoaspartyl peptidase/L-asparaginase [Bacteroidales bacterium]|nr:isoaspartyl peptidase/L-asparaginase [Bacteroidales bacterium]
MKRLFAACSFLLLLFIGQTVYSQGKYALVIHGGGGNIPRESITPEMEAAFLAKLREALQEGQAILSAGGSSLDAVQAAVVILEDSPLFNAGRGAVFTIDGRNELDASIMDGSNLKAGAVAGVTTIKNPIKAARRVMENTPHVLLSGRGAEQFAFEQGLEIVDPSYFFDQRRWDQYREFIRENSPLRGSIASEMGMGTVGAVALDLKGNLAAATSTGGMTGKKHGRIGDSPIIGAGTYANNLSSAVSSTGHGEFFIRNAVAYDISARILYLGETLEQATYHNIMVRLVQQGARGGVIAVDRNGNISMPFNTTAMFRGYIKSTGETEVKIFR